MQMLLKVPRGQVTTYGALSAALSSAPRAVGQVRARMQPRASRPRGLNPLRKRKATEVEALRGVSLKGSHLTR